MTDAQRVLDRLIEACTTGKECRLNAGPGYGRPAAISVGGVGQLNRHKVFSDAMRLIIDLDGMHPLAQRRWLGVWSRIPLRMPGVDDDLLFAGLRKMLPQYVGPGVTAYRGQRKGAGLAPSFARQPHIAFKFALFGMSNVDPVKLAISDKAPVDLKPYDDAEFVTAFAPPDAIICDAQSFGHPEGELIVDPRRIDIRSREPAQRAAGWVREHTTKLWERSHDRA